MKIAINTLPLQTGHKQRGIGFYTKNLLAELEKDSSITIEKFTDNTQLVDVDIVHYPWYDLFFRSLPLWTKYPLIVSVHDVVPLIFPKFYPAGFKGKINFLFQKFALKNCKAIITDSLVSKKNIIKHLGIKSEKIVAIPLAAGKEFRVLEDTQLIRTRRKYNLPDDFLLYVGDANWVKNLPFLIKGFNELIKTASFKNLKLVLVGNVFLKNVENINHPELESLKLVNRLIKENNLTEFIIRPGFLEVSELVSFYNLATAYVQPSLYEGFGLSVVEAMKCGTPVICSNAGSLPEVGGGSVIYFDPKSSYQFIKILIMVLENKSLQFKFSKLGLSQAEKFSWEQTARETKKVYSEAIGL